MNLYLTRSGRLRRRDNTLRFERVNLPETEDPEVEAEELDEEKADAVQALPVESIDAVYVFGELSVNTKLINFLNCKKVPVHFSTGTAIIPVRFCRMRNSSAAIW